MGQVHFVIKWILLWYHQHIWFTLHELTCRHVLGTAHSSNGTRGMFTSFLEITSNLQRLYPGNDICHKTFIMWTPRNSRVEVATGNPWPVDLGNCWWHLVSWMTTQHKLHKIWRSLKFCTNSGIRAHPRTTSIDLVFKISYCLVKGKKKPCR